MLRKALLVCGILSSLVYAVSAIFPPLAWLNWEDYSYKTQTISELFAFDAPTRTVSLLLCYLYDVLLIAFGVGVWLSSGQKRSLRVTAAMLILVGILGFPAPFTSMHLREVLAAGGDTLADTMHLVITGMISICIFIAVGFGAVPLGIRFRIYSIVTIVAMLMFGGIASMDAGKVSRNEPTPWVGVTERINLVAYLMWVAVTAVVLWRTQGFANDNEAGSL